MTLKNPEPKPRRGPASAAAHLATTLLALFVLVGSPTPAFAVPSAPASRYASIVVEAETGNVLYERNADLPRCPASLTKMMTLYLTFEALAAKKLALADNLSISTHAATRDPSRLDLTPGAKLNVEDAIRAITTKSANDAACALAEALGKGSEPKFAEMMTAKGKALGLQHTTFKNASGLPEDGHMTTARDLAVLSRALVRDYPDYYRYFSTNSFDWKGMRYPNQNRFLHTYYGADGIKTGFVNASGHNLAASAVRGGKRLIAIVLGGDTQAWTREHASRLLDVSYAKIDPSLVMVASATTTDAPVTASGNDTAANTAPVAIPAGAAPAVASAGNTVKAVATNAVPASIAPTATAPPVPHEQTYATPGGAVTISSSPSLPISTVTANVAAYAAAASAPKAPAGSVGGAPTAVTPPVAAAAPVASAKPVATNALSSAASATPIPVSAGVAAHAAVLEKTDTAARVDTDRRVAVAVATKAGAAPTTAQAPDPGNAGGDWSVQVGLFRDAIIARRRGEEARSQMPLALRSADLIVGRAQDGIHVTSRIGRLSEQDARAACSQLQRGRVPCVVVPPGRPLIVATN